MKNDGQYLTTAWSGHGRVEISRHPLALPLVCSAGNEASGEEKSGPEAGRTHGRTEARLTQLCGGGGGGGAFLRKSLSEDATLLEWKSYVTSKYTTRTRVECVANEMVLLALPRNGELRT